MFQQFTLTDKDYWMSFFLRNISLHPLLQFLLEMFILLLYAMLYQPPPCDTKLCFARTSERSKCKIVANIPQRDQTAPLWRSYDKSRFAPQTSALLVTNKLQLFSLANSATDSRVVIVSRGLRDVLKPKPSTCTRNQSSPLIDYFKSSFCTVTQAQDSDNQFTCFWESSRETLKEKQCNFGKGGSEMTIDSQSDIFVFKCMFSRLILLFYGFIARFQP